MAGRLVLMAQHPRCLFAYWETGGDEGGQPLVLCLHELGAGPSGALRSERVGPVGKRYFYPVAPGRLYCLELGIVRGGVFVPLLRSNVAETPPGDEAEAGGGPAAACGYSPFAEVGEAWLEDT